MDYSKENLNNTGIYAICNRVNDKVYVGSAGQSFNRRWTKHVSKLNKGTHHSKHLQAAWNKYGQENFNFLILEVVYKEEWKDDRYLIDVEQLWLDATQACDPSKGYNICSTAGSTLGLKHTEEARKKMSGRVFSDEHRKRLSESRKGIVFTDETRKKMSESRKGRVFSDEHRKKIGEAGKGRILSDEHRRKLFEANTGRVHSDKAKKKMSDAKCKYTYTLLSPKGVEYIVKNLTQFCKEQGLNQSKLCRVVQGIASHHKGWTGTRILNI